MSRTPRIPTRKTALTYKEVIALVEGLNVISKGREVTVDGKNVPRGFIFPDQTGGDTRYTLTRIAILLKPIVDTFNEENNNLFREYSTGKDGKPNMGEDKDGKPRIEVPADRINDYNAAVEKLYNQKTEGIEHPVLCYEYLNVGDDKQKKQNPISPNAIAAIEPIMVWTEEEYKSLLGPSEAKPVANKPAEAETEEAD